MCGELKDFASLFYPECKVMQIRECNVFVIYTQKCWMRWEKEALARLHQLCLLGWGEAKREKRKVVAHSIREFFCSVFEHTLTLLLCEVLLTYN